MKYSGIIGFVLAIAIISIGILLGSDLHVFFNPPSLIFVLGLTIGLGLLSFGAQKLFFAIKTVFSLTLLGRTPNPEQVNLISVIRGLRKHLYYSAMIGAFIGWVQILSTLDDPAALGPAVAVSIFTIFYALIFDQIFCQPALHRIALADK
ncbi:hypothetical protein ACQZV8_11975 [Magnetococcales bacterium HHB-1]